MRRIEVRCRRCRIVEREHAFVREHAEAKGRTCRRCSGALDIRDRGAGRWQPGEVA